MKKIILLDRDGIINYDSKKYIKSVAELVFLPGSLTAIARLTAAGYRIGIATNQSGIARGYYDERILKTIHDKLIQEISAAGGHIEAIEHCPHLPDSGCLCRKPKPGMLHKLAIRLNCSLENVPFLGDQISDIQAAEAAGATPIFISTPENQDHAHYQKSYPYVASFASLSDFVDDLLSTNPASPPTQV